MSEFYFVMQFRVQVGLTKKIFFFFLKMRLEMKEKGDMRRNEEIGFPCIFFQW